MGDFGRLLEIYPTYSVGWQNKLWGNTRQYQVVDESARALMCEYFELDIKYLIMPDKYIVQNRILIEVDKAIDKLWDRWFDPEKWEMLGELI